LNSILILLQGHNFANHVLLDVNNAILMENLVNINILYWHLFFNLVVCNTCMPEKYMSATDTSCLAECPTGFYIDILLKKCHSCKNNCIACSNNISCDNALCNLSETCILCEDLFFHNPTGDCLPDCPAELFYKNT